MSLCAALFCNIRILLITSCRNMPDIETLMQEWPPEFEELLNQVSITKFDGLVIVENFFQTSNKSLPTTFVRNQELPVLLVFLTCTPEPVLFKRGEN